MVAKCVNPKCREPFIYFRHGRLFRFELSTESRSNRNIQEADPTRRTEIFWLCGRCSAKWTLTVRHDRVEVAPIGETRNLARTMESKRLTPVFGNSLVPPTVPGHSDNPDHSHYRQVARVKADRAKQLLAS